MEKRSESDIVRKVLTLTFGGKEYEIPVLRMNAAAKWRKDFHEMVKEVSSSMIVDDALGNINAQVSNSLASALLKFPEKIPELVFSYASSITEEDRKQILEEAYDQEFSLAFKKIWQVAFEPFLEGLGTVNWMQKLSASRSESSDVLN